MIQKVPLLVRRLVEGVQDGHLLLCASSENSGSLLVDVTLRLGQKVSFERSCRKVLAVDCQQSWDLAASNDGKRALDQIPALLMRFVAAIKDVEAVSVGC